MREPHPVGAVVDPHRDSLHPHDLREEEAGEGQGQVAVGDGGPERTLRRGLGVDVDPLVVAGGLREQVYAVLVDGDPVAATQMAADGAEQVLGGGEHGGHASDATGPRAEVTPP